MQEAVQPRFDRLPWLQRVPTILEFFLLGAAGFAAGLHIADLGAGWFVLSQVLYLVVGVLAIAAALERWMLGRQAIVLDAHGIAVDGTRIPFGAVSSVETPDGGKVVVIRGPEAAVSFLPDHQRNGAVLVERLIEELDRRAASGTYNRHQLTGAWRAAAPRHDALQRYAAAAFVASVLGLALPWTGMILPRISADLLVLHGATGVPILALGAVEFMRARRVTAGNEAAHPQREQRWESTLVRGAAVVGVAGFIASCSAMAIALLT